MLGYLANDQKIFISVDGSIELSKSQSIVRAIDLVDIATFN